MNLYKDPQIVINDMIDLLPEGLLRNPSLLTYQMADATYRVAQYLHPNEFKSLKTLADYVNEMSRDVEILEMADSVRDFNHNLIGLCRKLAASLLFPNVGSWLWLAIDEMDLIDEIAGAAIEYVLNTF